MKRDGHFVPVSWAEAFAEVEARLLPIIRTHSGNAVATYLGNPSAHNMASMFFGPSCASRLGLTDGASAMLTDDRLFDAISGNAAVNGVPVTISPC